MEVFRPVAEEAFASRVLEYLQKSHADTAVHLPAGELLIKEIATETLRGMVKHGIAQARTYGMTWESSLMTFVVFMFMVAPNFDAHPLIQLVLKDPTVEPDHRIEKLWERTTEDNWQAAKQQYDLQAWNLNIRE
jgi:hypothetical protein